MFYTNILIMSGIYKHCEYCNKGIKHQSNWIRHTKTKKHLKNIKEKEITTDNNQNIPDHTQNIPDYTQNIPTKHQCRYCNKVFKYQPGLSRHENHRCDKRPAPQTINNTINNNGNTNNNSHNTNNNNTIIINFGDELVEFTDDFLDQITDTSLLNQERRKMIENYISSKQKTLKKTNMRDDLMYILKNNDWKVIPEKLAIKERMSNIPNIYRKSAINTIKNWDEEVDNEYKKDTIKTHMNISNKIEKNNFTKEENKELETIIKCNAYNKID
jgi:hypothetical protein